MRSAKLLARAALFARAALLARQVHFARAAVLALVAFSGGTSAARAAAPTLTRLFPAGGQRGTKVTVVCTGSFDWPPQVHAPGVDVAPAQESGKLEVSIPSDLATDRVWIRLYNKEGTSAAMPFLIGSLREVVEQEPNNSPRNAQTLEDSSTTINGVLEGADVDGFSLHLTAGQTLVAAVDANDRLGSPMDAILQVTAPDGTVQIENHDNIGLDPRLAFTVPRDGKYVVRVFAFSSTPNTNIALQGGPEYVYRLTLTTGPFVTHSIPSAVSQTEPSTVELFGWNIPPHTRVPVVPLGGEPWAGDAEVELAGDPRNAPASRLGFALALGFANAARVRLVPHSVGMEITQASGDPPPTLLPPTVVTGWLQKRRQIDTFRVSLVKGQVLVAAVETRSLNLPLHPVVKLVDPAGAVAVAVEPPELQDAVLTHTAAQDGEYRLLVSDRYRLGGERCFYRLSVRLDEADFSLAASADAVVVTAEKPTEFPLTIQRRAAPNGAVGPITIEVVGLPPGVTAPPVISEPAGPTSEKVTLVLSSTGAGYSGPIRIVGKASVPKELQRPALTPARFSTYFDAIWLTAVPNP